MESELGLSLAAFAVEGFIIPYFPLLLCMLGRLLLIQDPESKPA